MERENNLTKEIGELNNHLKELKTSGKHMIYSASPFKFAFFNFIAGVFHSLGILFGYIVIFGIIVYLFSQMNFSGLITKWIESTLGQIEWGKVMPSPNLQDLPNDLRLPGGLKNLEEQLEIK